MNNESKKQDDMFDPKLPVKNLSTSLFDLISGKDPDDVINALSSVLGVAIFECTPHAKAAREVSIQVSAQINFIAQDMHIRRIEKAINEQPK